MWGKLAEHLSRVASIAPRMRQGKSKGILEGGGKEAAARYQPHMDRKGGEQGDGYI